MTKVNVYLNFAGNAEEAFKFYKSVFGGDFGSLVRFKDMPMEGAKIPQADQSKIMHIALPVGKEYVLMASDTLESLGQKLVVGNNYYISLHTGSRLEADKVFQGLSKGGKVEMALADQPWGDYWGSFRDKFGVQWMVSFTPPKKK